MNLETKLEHAVEYGLGLNHVNITLHALMRYIERSHKKDIALMWHEANMKLGWHRAGKKMPDDVFLNYIARTNPKMFENARDDLMFYTNGKFESFVADDMKFVIKENSLVTVYEI